MKPTRVLGSLGTGAGSTIRNVRFVAVIHGVAVALIAAMAAGVTVTLVTSLFHWQDLSQGILQTLNILCIAVGSVASGKRAQRQGWVHGGLVGLLYYLIAFWSLSEGAGLTTMLTGDALRGLILAILAGATGGMFGVNF